MTMKFEPDIDSRLIDDIIDACVAADARDTGDQHVSEQALLGIVWWILFNIGEEDTADMLEGVLRNVKDGSFAAMWKDIHSTEYMPLS